MYENVILHKTFNISKGDDIVINEHVNIPRRSMTGILCLFTENFVAGTRDSEKFVNLKITSVNFNIDGMPSKLYSNGMVPGDFWENVGTFLEEALRDRFVCGLRSKQAQKKLLAESKLTWQKALEMATAMESAEKQANQFRTQGTPVNVNAMPARFTKDKKKTQKEQKPCFRCGGSHAPQVCRYQRRKVSLLSI